MEGFSQWNSDFYFWKTATAIIGVSRRGTRTDKTVTGPDIITPASLSLTGKNFDKFNENSPGSHCACLHCLVPASQPGERQQKYTT